MKTEQTIEKPDPEVVERVAGIIDSLLSLIDQFVHDPTNYNVLTVTLTELQSKHGISEAFPFPQTQDHAKKLADQIAVLQAVIWAIDARIKQAGNHRSSAEKDRAFGTLLRSVGIAVPAHEAPGAPRKIPRFDPGKETDKQWVRAIAKFNEELEAYETIGPPGFLALEITFRPLAVRIQTGERSPGLLKEILGLK